MKGKKLPNVWVMFDGDEPSDVALRKDPEDRDVYRYTPAKPVKTCRWSEVVASTLSDTECGGSLVAWNWMKFCPYCGGKIKVTR